MGVPKFFRFISERYPCLNELIKEHQISDFDNLYLDMNGIIHSCSHPDDSNPHFRITEEKIFAEIFHYITFLFQLIRPKKLFFMAIDGVAPRAKMNQQRGRRFRTAKEALDIEKKAQEKGETLPEGKRFDSNCITPGTVFMARLHEQLRYFVKQKISSDSLWGRCRIVLSGHETPGEGEHKIMDYIRYLKTQPDHDPNTRHCLYGLDADLIMLGLCTHEPNFSLLREEVKFGRQAQKSTSPTENDFFLLHLSLLKDYIEQEFLCIQDKIPFGYDIERVIDDWVLMGFLVGNDFIPPLPHLHIHTNGFLLLYETYKKVIVKLDGYMNEGGILNLQRFEVFMKELSSLDKESFQDVYADLKFFETKTGRRWNAQEKKDFKNYVPDDNETFGALDMNTEWTSQSEDLKRLILETNMIDRDDSNSDEEDRGDLSDDDEMFNNEFKLHRHDYYKTKLDYENVTPEVLQQQAECYVRAIQWVLHYYYQGCCSWSWYYPHHYAPFITDIVDFKNMNLNFDMGTPFKPFEQLLAVLPAASKDLLPEPFHHLMTNPNSPIYSYYPENFQTDLNGKQNEWEAVVLIPFIDETQLLSAMEPFYQLMTDEELKRNSHGPMLIYNYTVENLGEYHAPEYFPPILSCHAREVPVDRLELQIPPEKVIRGPLPNPKRGTYFPGIPTLKTLQFTSHFTKAQVKVFDYPSRNENCILNIKYDHEKELPLEELAKKLLGKIVWVSWPHLQRARICQVSNSEKRIRYIAKDTVETEIQDDEVKFVLRESNSSKISEFDIDKRTIVDHLSRRLGIDAGEITTIVHATSLKGFSHTFGTDGTIINGVEWCKVPSPYPLQAIIEKLDVPPLFTTRNLPIHEVLPKGDKVFLKANPYYGCSAEVVDSTGFAQTSRIKVSVLVEPEPKILPRTQAKNSYLTPYNAATRSGISSFLLSRLTGCIFVSRTQNCEDRNRSVNIGLNIKFSKKNEEVAGYTKRKDTKWLYSEKCVDLILEYHNKFPELIETLEAKVNKDRYALSDLFPEETGETKLFEVANWLKDHPYKKAATRSCDSEYLEPDEIVELYNSIVSQKANLQKERKSLLVQVKPHRLFKPELHGGKMPPDISVHEYKLYDRVINVNSRSTVPLGLKGTIVGVSRTKHPSSVNLSETLNSEPIYLILFDEPFIGGASEEGINESRMFKLQCHSLLNITRGRGDLPEVNKGIRNIKLNSDTTSNITDNYRNLRNNDGHNSAFANYTSPTKHINDSTWYNSKYQAPKVPQPHIQQQVSQDIGVLSNNDEQSNTLKSMLNINKNSTNPKTVSSNTHGQHAGQNVPTLMPPWQFMSPYQTMASHSPMSPNPSMMPNSLMSSHPPNLSMLPNPSMQSHPLMPSNPSMQSQPPMPPNPSLQSHPLMLPNPSMQSHPPMPPNPLMQSHPPMPPNPSMQSHPQMPPNPSMQSHPPMPPNPSMASHPMMQPYPSMPPYPSMQPQSLMGHFQPQAGLNFGMQYQNVSNVFPGMTIYNQTNNHPQVPTNIQLPFPNKFLDQPPPSNNVSSRQRTDGAPGAAGNAVPSQFIPLQAVRQRNNGPMLEPQKPYRKPSTENDSVPAEVSDKMGNSTTNSALSTSQLTQVSAEGQKPPTRVRQKKSRLAANFGGEN